MKEPVEIVVPVRHEIAAQLITLLDIKRAEVARATKNNPANLSQWLQGRDKLLSLSRQEDVLEWLGLVNSKLDASRIHHWHVGNDFTALRGVLQATETPGTLTSLSIHKVDGERSHDARSPVMLKFDRLGSPVVVLVHRTASAGKHPLILNASTIGFGRDGADVQIPQSLIDSDISELTAEEFFKQCQMNTRSNVTNLSDPFFTSHRASSSPDQLLTEMERTIAALRKDVTELRCHEAGLRGVIRKLLEAIRQTAPDHPLLDKKTRKSIYADFYQADTMKKEGITKKPSY